MPDVQTETHRDSDGQPYELAFVQGPDGAYHAFALSIPWSDRKVEEFDVHERHLYCDGEICLQKEGCPSMETAKQRARLWCEAFSHLMEHGLENTKRALPEW